MSLVRLMIFLLRIKVRIDRQKIDTYLCLENAYSDTQMRFEINNTVFNDVMSRTFSQVDQKTSVSVQYDVPAIRLVSIGH